MAQDSETALHGMKEISAYCRRSEATIISWIQTRDFPASKIGGGVWESDRGLIDDWRRGQINGGDDSLLGGLKQEGAIKKDGGRDNEDVRKVRGRGRAGKVCGGG